MKIKSSNSTLSPLRLKRIVKDRYCQNLGNMAKTPRFVPYSKLIYRLYEALYMLDILKHNILGPHHVANLDFSTLLAVRRRFLGNIAFFCDYTKGGRTSTAVAIEDGRICNTFWVSSNEGPQEEVRTFVESVITKAKAFHAIPDDQKAEAEIDLTGQCINFALSRIRKQAHGLSNSAQSCRKFITATMTDQQGERSPEILRADSLHSLISESQTLDNGSVNLNSPVIKI